VVTKHLKLMKISEKYLANISVASVCALLFIWVLPNTIALRHGLLVVGCISGAFLIKKNWNSFYPFKAKLMPLYAIICLFIWVGIHYCFFSLNPALELSEIKGLWIRTFFGFIMAMGFAIALSQNNSLRKYFYISIFFVPIINVLAYVYACYLNGGFIEPNAFVFFLYAKIETAYFGALAASLAVSNIIYFLVVNKTKYPPWTIGLYVLGIVLVLVSALVSTTKNGIAIALGLCALLFLVILVNATLNAVESKLFSLGVAVFILIAATIVWQGHKSVGYKGWDTVFQDAKTGLDVDKNQQWQKLEGSVSFPLNSLGIPAVANTYTRFAYAAVGVRLISQYPLGYGSVNQSFNGLQGIAEIPHEHRGQVHSGWIDFGLAFGLPGILFLLSSFFYTIYLGVRRHGELDLIAAVFSLTLLGFCLIAEMSYKQYFESWIFMMTFSATIVALSVGKKSK